MPRSLNVKLPQLRAVVLAVHATLGLSAWALPQGATIVNGQVSVAQPTAGSQVIKASNGAIINWRQFSIGAGESTQFVQPSAASAVLNRVTGPDLSQLLGQLKANGQVFLINPHGIVIGGAARIDTNSFIASTLDISDKDFLSGKLRFFAGSAAGRIHNDGVITAAPGGRIALIAPDIENSGIIQAPDGQILLAAGRKLEIASMDLEGVTFQIQAPTDSVLNLGKLLAENGAVRAFAGSLRQGGEIRAGRLVRDGDGSIVLAGSSDLTLTPDSITRADGITGGSIVLQSAHGTTRVSGDISATGSAGAGGDIRVLGDRVAVESGARIDASGSSGGGQILVGGDLQGKNPDVQNASRVYVAQGAQLKADATDEGNGGRVIVWADENTRYYGDLSAQGGAHGGNGGFAEVSGKTNLEFAGSANLGAPAGASGSLLLDPLDLIVSATSGILTTVVDEFADFIGNVVTVSPTTLAAVAGNVILQAARDIYIKNEIALTTAGAGITMTAGGALFDSGSIFNNAGIRTNAGAVTLRAESIFGVGGVTSTGGAVDLLTSGILQYSGAINSGGGNVTLASTTGYVNSSDVSAGSGTIQVTGQTGVFNGSYTTTGTANLAATTGSVSNTNVSAAVVNLTAPSSIFSYVDVGQRVNATSSGSGVQIYANGANPLRLGTVAGSSIYLQSSTGMEQASGGLLTSSFVTLRSGSSSTSTGTAAAPILIASPSALDAIRLNLYDMAAPAHIAFSGSPTVRNLSLEGTVAALGGTTIGGAANLTSLSMNAGTGVLNVPLARSTGGLGFELTVTDGGLNATTLDLPGGDIYLDSQSSLTLGTVTSAYLNATARGAVSIGSITTTGNSGISVSTQQCTTNAFVVCNAQSPITAGTLNAQGAGDVALTTKDNGDVTVTNIVAGDAITISAGLKYQTSPGNSNFATSQRTNNTVNLTSATSGGRFTLTDNGQGDINVASLTAGDRVTIQAGGTHAPVFYYVPQQTNNTISITNAEPASASGNFRVTNSGIGNLSVTGAVTRPSGRITLSTSDGSVTALGNLSARNSITVTGGGSGSVTVGQLAAGIGSSGSVTVNSGGNLVFDSASANLGDVTLTSTSGSIKTTVDNTAADVSATGDVTITANNATNGGIGNALFTNPMDIKAGPGMMITLSAGKDIGAPGKPVTVDVDAVGAGPGALGGTLEVTSSGGQFHVTTADSLSTIRLSASAAGIGSGNTSTFASADLGLTAASDGATITVGDLVRSGANQAKLDEFKFAATGASGLAFGNVNFTTAGYDQLLLSATNGLMQTLPVATNNISAGNISLAGGAGVVSVGNVASASDPGNSIVISATGNVTTGTLNGLEVIVSGADLSLASVTSTGDAARTYFDYYGDYIPRLGNYKYQPYKLELTGTGSVSTSGNIVSATSALVSAGTNVSINGGTGLVTAGNKQYYYYGADTAKLWTGSSAGNTVSAANISGYQVDLKGDTLQVGNLTAVGNLTLDARSLNTGTASGTNVTVAGTNFNTGNLTASGGTLSITATGAYAPASAVALSGGSATITAPGGIDLFNETTPANAMLTAPTVSLKASAGDIKATLGGTTNLTINSGIDTGGKFDVVSSGILYNLDIRADGTVAGAGALSRSGAPSSVSANGGNQLITVTNGAGLALDVKSSTGLDTYYRETSSVTDLAVNSIGTYAGGLVYISAPVANITTPSLVIGNGSLQIYTAGDVSLGSVAFGSGSVYVVTEAGTVDLTSVTTGGGSVYAQTRGDNTKNINVESVVTRGGNVSLIADNGSIVRAVGAASPQIDSSIPSTVPIPSGILTLSAPNGSVGTALAPIQTTGPVTLDVNARNELAVDVATTPLTNLYITTSASGTGAVSVNNSNFGTLSVARTGSGADLTLTGLSPVAAGAFSLTATDGNIKVGSDISNVTSLTLNAGNGFNSTGDLVIRASGGPRSVVADSMDLRAGRDLVIAAGSVAGENVSVAVGSTNYGYVYAGHDLLVTADGGSALLSYAAPFYTMYMDAGHDIRVTGGSAGVVGATAAITAVGYQQMRATNDLVVQGGSSDVASAKVTAGRDQGTNGINNLTVRGGGKDATAQLTAGGSQNFANVFGTATVEGGSGSASSARIEALAGTQDIGGNSYYYYHNADQVVVQGGTGIGASAAIRAASSQQIYSTGDIKVLGGSVSGTDAEILSFAGSQNVGSTYRYYSPATRDIVVQAGVGGTAKITANGSQNIQAGGIISVLGGSGPDTAASIETTADQTMGTSYQYYYYAPTGNILVQGGTGSGAVASVKATGDQTINTGGTITVGRESVNGIPTGNGNSGAGANAEIVSTNGRQTIGSTYNSYFSNDSTGSILVQAGSGGIAKIQAQLDQTIMTSGDLSVIGGSGSNMTAAIESITGSQTIGNASNVYYNDPSKAVLVKGGSATGASASINAANNQTFNQADSISLIGGSAPGSYAKMSSGGYQQLSTSANLSLTGGAGDNSGAMLLAGTGQSLEVSGNLSMLGGSGSAPGLNETAIRNTSGSQFIDVGGDLRITGGGFGSDTWIKQNGAGTQDIMVGGNLALLAPAATPGTGVTSIEALAGGQDIRVGRAMSIDNQGGWLTYVTTTGTQDITAQSLAISLSSTNGTNPFAGLSSIGDMSINLSGDGSSIPDPTDPSKTIVAPSATLTVANLSGAAGSLAAIKTSGNLSILMDYQQGRSTNYDAAGLMRIGDVDGQGAATVSAAKDLTIVAGRLLLQGGATAASDAKLLSGDQPSLPPTGTMTISTLYGPVEMLGGAGGGAYIDPLFLDIVSNGAVLMQAGTNSSANTNITAGTFNLAATTGALGLYNSTTSSATSTITASNFNFSAVGTIVLNGGTITATNGGTFNSNVVPPGNPTLFCVNCATNLFGLFFFGTGASGSPLVGVPQPPVPQTGPGSIAAGDIAFLGEFAAGLFDLTFDESGNLVTTRRRLNQCY